MDTAEYERPIRCGTDELSQTIRFRRIQSGILNSTNRSEEKRNRVTGKTLLGVLLRLAKELCGSRVLKGAASDLREDIVSFLFLTFHSHSYSEQGVAHHLSLAHNDPLLRIKVE